jgi:hypothetical protein
MAVTINGDTGVTTPGISNSEGYTGDGLSIAAGAPSGAVVVDSSGNVGIGTSSPAVSGLEISRATGSASPTPAELRISTTSSNSDWSTTDPWGRLSFYSADTSSAGPKIVSAIDVTAEAASGGTGNISFKLAATTTGTLTERMRLDASGNLGLGVTPSAWASGYKVLQVGASTALWGTNGYSFLTENVYSNSSDVPIYINTGTNATMYRMDTGAHKWYTAPSGTAGNAISFTQAMTLTAAGELLVGKTSNDTTTSGTTVAKLTANVGAIRNVKTASGTYESIQNYYNGTYVGGITYSDTATALATSSDARLKESIEDAPDAFDVVAGLAVRSFNWKVNKEHQRFGFIAQEVESVFSEAVIEGGDKDKTKAIDFARFVPLLVKAIQEQQALIESLTARVVALEGQA